MSNNVAVIRGFLRDVVQANPQTFPEYFTEDAVSWNAPMPPVNGRAAIEAVFTREAERIKPVHWDIRYIVSEGNVVLTERIDHFVTSGEGNCHSGDGYLRIARWQDFSLARLLGYAAVPAPASGIVTANYRTIPNKRIQGVVSGSRAFRALDRHQPIITLQIVAKSNDQPAIRCGGTMPARAIIGCCCSPPWGRDSVPGARP
jgi:limonene-1,2-epoxide hydrolase